MTGFINADGSTLVGALNTLDQGEALRLDANGNLHVVAATDSTQPTITEDRLRAWLLAGQGFVGGTGQLNGAAGTTNNPLCIFNPAASGKSILIYSLSLSSGTAGANSIAALLQYVTVDPAYETPAVIVNARAGGAASTIAASCTFTAVDQSPVGSFARFVVSTQPIELLTHGSVIYLPAGSAHGVTVFLQTYAAGIGNITAHWIEL